MALASGTRLGVYEIAAALGAGAMGEVYRARDTKLNRDVAIKVLPPLLASDPARLARFEREAQTLALLNHPNVAHVYGLEGQALVMELVEGEDLAQRIARAAIAVDEAVPIALQIACGVEAAHERGIVHRDLKPANVKAAPGGTVKVLDFGLAKALDPTGSGSFEVHAGATVTSAGGPGPGHVETTSEGTIVGTAAYMAPEQARGRPVDKRADIWAFGCIVYEMLTAKRPFGGDTVTDALAAIVKEDPDWSALPSGTPAALRDLLRRCLIKDPKQRLRDIGDARIELERIVAHPGDESVPAAMRVASGRSHARPVAIAVAIGAIVASAATWLLVRPSPVPPAPAAQFEISLPLEALPLRAGGAGVALAPDGSSVVYAAQPALRSSSVLFRRPLDRLLVERMANTDGATAPFFSPDGRWIGYITGTAVMKVSADGQRLAKVADRTRFSRAAWAPGDIIVLGTSQIYSKGPLGKVPASGGTPTDLTTLEGTQTAHQLPHLLPDGRTVLFTVISPERSELAIVPIEGGPHRLLGVEGSGAVFVAPGHLMFARGRSMFAVPFDSRSHQVTGSPAQVLEDAAVLSVATGVWIPLLGADRSGSIAYLNKGGTLSTLRWIAPAPKAIPTPEADYRTPRLSPDGRRVVAVAGSAPSEIWVIDLDRGTRLLLGTSGGVSPVWSHDGQRIIYSSTAGDIRAVPSDGSGAPELVLPRVEGFNLATTGVAPDGSFTVVQADNRAASADGRNRDVWIVRSGQKPDPIAATTADERNGVVSPDGQWLAYSSSVSGREEIYLKNLSGSGRTIPVSSEGGTVPRWPRMDSLYFLGPRTLMRAPIRATPFSVGTPVEVAQLPQNVSGIDVHSDGRILIIEPKVAAMRDALHVLLNWGPSLR